MNSEIKAKWIAALLSGKYKQGVGFLNRDGTYCCLGVLAEVNNVPSQEASDGDYMSYAFDGKDFRSSKIIPPGYCGVSYEESSMLANLNDSGMTFPDIAGWIETQL